SQRKKSTSASTKRKNSAPARTMSPRLACTQARPSRIFSSSDAVPPPPRGPPPPPLPPPPTPPPNPCPSVIKNPETARRIQCPISKGNRLHRVQSIASWIDR